jgi:hypothetical protein
MALFPSFRDVRNTIFISQNMVIGEDRKAHSLPRIINIKYQYNRMINDE